MNTTEKEIISISTAVRNRVTAFINEKGISPYRLGKDTEISYNTLKTVLRGSNASVNLKTILQICRALGIKTAEFFNDPIFDSEYIDIE